MSQSPDYLQPGSVCEAGSRSLKLAKVEDGNRVRRCRNRCGDFGERKAFCCNSCTLTREAVGNDRLFPRS